MKRKYIIFFMQFFTTICIISVGFSSWVIVTPPIIAEGNIASSPVLSTDEYLHIEIEDIKYCEEGFVNDGLNSYIGYLTLNCTLQNLDHFNSVFCTYDLEGEKIIDYDSLKIKLTLSYNGYNLFKTTTAQSSTHIIDANGINISDSFPMGKQYNKYVIELTINDILTIVEDSYNSSTDSYSKTGHEFTITYKFTSSAAVYDQVYESLSTQTNKFSIDIRLEGCNRA